MRGPKPQSNGDLKHKEIWRGMLQRCNNPNQPNYKSYGALGATVCDRWDPKKGGSYENFISDMGYRPTDRHHLDKEAVDRLNLCYCPEKARWTPRKVNLGRLKRYRQKLSFVD